MKRAAENSQRNPASHLFFDEFGIVRYHPTLWTLTAISLGSLFMAQAYEDLEISYLIWACATSLLFAMGFREHFLYRVSTIRELSPVHVEIQNLRRRGRVRLNKILLPIGISLLLTIMMARQWWKSSLLLLVFGFYGLVAIGHHWVTNESREDKHRRLVARARQRGGSKCQRFRRWWATDWGVARPWIWLPCVVVFGAVPIIADIARSRPGIDVFDVFFLLEAVLFAFLGLNFFPAARWKMITAREARGE
ncbi:MAG: hypothetical protein IT350_04550 [Deltaproteobacteria bacterium]|nr:hypothetical protein [Deltaproteobacteria bacterium]